MLWCSALHERGRKRVATSSPVKKDFFPDASIICESPTSGNNSKKPKIQEIDILFSIQLRENKIKNQGL